MAVLSTRYVVQLDCLGKWIATYKSPGKAAKALGLPSKHDVRKVCRGKVPHAYGYYFAFARQRAAFADYQ